LKVFAECKNNILKALVKFWGYSIIIQEEQIKNNEKNENVPTCQDQIAEVCQLKFFQQDVLFLKLCHNFQACRALLTLIGPFSRSLPKVWQTPKISFSDGR